LNRRGSATIRFSKIKTLQIESVSPLKGGCHLGARASLPAWFAYPDHAGKDARASLQAVLPAPGLNAERCAAA